MSNSSSSGLGAIFGHRGNLLNAAVRRDIAELNRMFLERALDPATGADTSFRLPVDAVARLAAASLEARERAAQSPVTLFELSLPRPDEFSGWSAGAAVADADSAGPEGRSCAEARHSFGLVALGVARRLAEGLPLSPRIAFGFGAAVESRLSGLSPCEWFRVASWPGLIRPRWPSHSRYWNLLAGAAEGDKETELSWAYSAGVCLLEYCERAPSAVVPGNPRRQIRPTHRRPPAGGSDVPC
jgi:hypothetical protein